MIVHFIVPVDNPFSNNGHEPFRVFEIVTIDIFEVLVHKRVYVAEDDDAGQKVEPFGVVKVLEIFAKFSNKYIVAHFLVKLFCKIIGV
jgi:hypothetical protein